MLAISTPLASSCADALAGISAGPSSPAMKIEQMTDAVAARYTTPERSGRFETARRRLVSGALVPSRAFADSSIWSSFVQPSTRVLAAHGSLTEHGYRFEMATDLPALTRIGDTRHSIALKKLNDGEYSWNTGVDFAIGSITPADFGTVLLELMTNGHERDPAALRSVAYASFPRSSALMAKIFTIDSLTLHPGGQGTTTVAMSVNVRPDELRKTSPHFADYITRYVAKSKYRFTLLDRSGAMYFEATGADQRLNIRYRVRGGALVSFFGPPRPMPDTLRLTNDFSIHVKVFDVGWKALDTDFFVRRSDHGRSWLIVAQREPDWQLPLITERLLRGPLRRPFQGNGASFEIGIFDSIGTQTSLTRHTHLEVKESAILRFLSGLVGRVFSDLDAEVEREEAAYFRDLILALQQDALHKPGNEEGRGISPRP